MVMKSAEVAQRSRVVAALVSPGSWPTAQTVKFANVACFNPSAVEMPLLLLPLLLLLLVVVVAQRMLQSRSQSGAATGWSSTSQMC
jgi:hypothetical protein